MTYEEIAEKAIKDLRTQVAECMTHRHICFDELGREVGLSSYSVSSFVKGRINGAPSTRRLLKDWVDKHKDKEDV